jgi:hypothetical protein
VAGALPHGPGAAMGFKADADFESIVRDHMATA